MNNIPNLPLVDGHFLIDNSTLERYITCRRSYEYYGLHRRETSEERSGLLFGGLIHKCLQLRYEWEARTSLSTLDTEFDEIEKAQFGIIEDHFATHVPKDGDHRTAPFAQELVLLYNKYYLSEPWRVIRLRDGHPLVEVPFVTRLCTLQGPDGKDIPVEWIGRIDAVVTQNNQILHIDHKTSSMGGDRFFDEFINDQAQIGYAWAIQETLGIHIDGFIINALICRKPTATGKGFEFLRRKFDLPQDRMREWQSNTATLVEDLFRDHARGYFPMHTKWCVGKYGRCPYLDVCSVPQEGRLPVLYSGLYRDAEFSPLNQPQKT